MSEGIQISLQEFYGEFRSTVSTLNQAVTTLNTAVQRLDNMEQSRDRHEERIGSLERWKAKIIGISIGVSAVVGVASSLIVVLTKGA